MEDERGYGVTAAVQDAVQDAQLQQCSGNILIKMHVDLLLRLWAHLVQLHLTFLQL